MREFIVTLVLLLVLDAVWLFIRSDFHKSFFANVQGSPLTVRWIPAVIVYLLLAFALVSISKGAKNMKDAALRGGIVGGVMYGFYDATNMATLKGWTWEMVITDTLWGIVGSGLTGALSYNYLYQ
jgi:uncharacterized membrane protein